MSMAVFFIPYLFRQHRSRVQQSTYPSGQHGSLSLAQQNHLAQQNIQGRSIQDQNFGVLLQRPLHSLRQGAGSFGPTLLHLRQKVQQNFVEQFGRKAAQSFRNSLLAHRIPRWFNFRIASVTDPTCRQIKLSTKAIITGRVRMRWRNPIA